MSHTDKFVAMLERTEDEHWARYQRIYAKASAQVEYSKLATEIQRLHGSRSSRTLLLKPNVGADHIIRANLEDMSYRSRLVEITVVISRQRRLLDTAITALNSHLLTNYGTAIAERVGRTKADRQMFVDSVLHDGWTVVGQMDKLSEMAQAVIEDIDKGSWNYRNLVALLTLVMQRENIVSGATI